MAVVTTVSLWIVGKNSIRSILAHSIASLGSNVQYFCIFVRELYVLSLLKETEVLMPHQPITKIKQFYYFQRSSLSLFISSSLSLFITLHNWLFRLFNVLLRTLHRIFS
jgi:hypothetical protein